MLEQSCIPEVVEEYIGEAIAQRKVNISQFTGLGPADMVTMVKYISTSNSPMNALNSTNGSEVNGKEKPVDFNGIINHTEGLKGEIGTFFYTMGIDSSDSTAIAVSLKDIADSISEQPQHWFDKVRKYHVERLTLSTWNSFRLYDVVTVVNIPGNLATYVLNEKGEEIKNITQEDFQLIILESFISSVVRSILLMKASNEEVERQPLVETMIFNPLMTGQIKPTVETFIELFPMVYENGYLLGSAPTVTNTTKTNNYLIDTLVEIVKLTNHVKRAKEMLLNLSQTHIEVLVVLVKILLECEMEYDAFLLINELLSTDYTNVSSLNILSDEDKYVYIGEVLYLQANYLLEIRKEFKFARTIAIKCTELIPNEIKPWLLLSKVYLKLGDIKNSLYSLNCIPTAVVKDKYILKRIVDLSKNTKTSFPRLHLPLPLDVKLEAIDSVDSINVKLENDSCDPELKNLPSSTLKPIFQMVYCHLSSITRAVSWEKLLQIRSDIFLMEEEYLKEPQTVEDLNKRPAGNKRLCERWLDNLFMILYEDLRVYSVWRKQQLFYEAQENTISHSTTEWELYGLCASRLGFQHEAASAFEFGLSQRFSPVCAKKLLNYYIYIHNNQQRESNSLESKLPSSKILKRMEENDKKIIDLCVKIACWNHRWYIDFSLLILNAMGLVVQDMGISKLSNEIRSNFPEDVHKFIKRHLLTFFDKYTNNEFDV